VEQFGTDFQSLARQKEVDDSDGFSYLRFISKMVGLWRESDTRLEIDKPPNNPVTRHMFIATARNVIVTSDTLLEIQLEFIILIM
jgi:hypothetical protein